MSGGNIRGRIPKPVKSNNSSSSCEDGSEMRRGPWTLEEDNLLIQYISCHGEGRWNSLAKSSGLNRTGKSCRLRWLNYLKPDIKRGNLTPQEQLLILELHSKWGNRWSKIAQHLPGRTDNEIKNYWRTRVQKQARQLKVDSNSDKFLETIRMYWMPRLLEKIEQNSSSSLTSSPSSSATSLETQSLVAAAPSPFADQDHPFLIRSTAPLCPNQDNMVMVSNSNTTSSMEIPDAAGLGLLTAPPLEQSSNSRSMDENECYHVGVGGTNPYDDMEVQELNSHVGDIDWFGEDIGSTFWNTDELWQFRKAGPEGVLGV